jgi:hypothetical protein
MRLNDDRMQEARDNRIRAIVREEIVNALGVLRRAADHEFNSTESEIAERAATVLESVAGSTAYRLTCPHERYTTWGSGPRCSRCGEPEPEPEPENPFEKPLDPHCDHAFAVEGSVRSCQICGGVKTNGTS